MAKQTPKTIYHYCSIETFSSIVKNHTLRFADITKSNDSDEILLAFDLFFEYQNLKDKEELKKKFEEDFKATKTYCFCLSSECDLLSQWRGYAQNGGISIGFDLVKLKEYFSKIFVGEKNLKLDKVQYLSKHNLTNIFDKDKKQEKNFFDYEYSKLMEFAPIYKDIGFCEECEWRVYFQCEINNNDYSNLPSVVVSDDKDTKEIKVDYQLQNNNDFKSYYDIPFSFDLIKEIIIGPKSKISTDEVFKLLSYYDRKNELKITKEDIKLTKLSFR